MTRSVCFRNGVVLLLTFVCFCTTDAVCAKDTEQNICSLVSTEQLSGIYRKKLFPTELRQGCFWSEEPGAMAYLQIEYHKQEKAVRDYFYKDLPSHVRLEKIKDLGDGGLMSVNSGELEVIVVEKNGVVLKSMVSFLGIEPGSKRCQKLWDLYRSILEKL